MRAIRIFLSTLVIFFIFLGILVNIIFLTTDEYWPDYNYYSDNLVISVYILAILFDVILLILISIFIYNDFENKVNENINKGIRTVILILFFIIWYEAIYRTFWYYWGFHSNQGGLLDVNNLGIFGSFILILYFIFMFRSDSIQSRSKKITIYVFCIFVLFIFHALMVYMLTPL